MFELACAVDVPADLLDALAWPPDVSAVYQHGDISAWRAWIWAAVASGDEYEPVPLDVPSTVMNGVARLGVSPDDVVLEDEQMDEQMVLTSNAHVNSYEYRQEVLQRLDPDLSTDRALSFRNELADQWYDLNNPEQTPNPMSVSFETGRADFLPNLSDLAVENILLYLVGEDDTELDKIPVRLTFTNDGGTVGGESMPIDGIISTRKGNGSSWMPTIGRTPIGTWTLSFPDTAEVRRLFEEDRLTDILVVLTYRGLTLSWPQ